MRLFGQVAPGLVHGKAVGQRQGLQGLGVERRGAPRPRRHRALMERLVPVWHHQVRVEGQLHPQAVAGRTGPGRGVEGEQPRLDLGDGEAGNRAGELLGEQQPPGRVLALGHVGVLPDGDAVGEIQAGLQRVRQALLQPRLGDDAVHHHVDVVLDLLVEGRGVLDRVELAVDLQPLVAGLAPLGDLLAVLALAGAHHGGEQVEPRAFRQGHDLVDHLADGLALDRQAGGRGVGHAHPRPEQAHVVVDLRHRADGGAGIFGSRLLFNRNGRRQALDQVHVRLAHQLQELAGVGRQAFHVTPLTLGIDGVEGERALARTGQPREHHELLARDVHVDVLQIVLTRAAHADEAVGIGHSRLTGARPGTPQPNLSM